MIVLLAVSVDPKLVEAKGRKREKLKEIFQSDTARLISYAMNETIISFLKRGHAMSSF